MTKQFAAILVGASLLVAGVTAAQAQTYPEPNKRSSVIVAATAGSGSDITGRLVTSGLETAFPGNSYQVVNLPGAGLQIGMQALADAPKDGYTLGLTSLPTVITLSMDAARGAQFDRDSFIPVANFAYDPGAIAVQVESPYQTLEDFIAAAKAKPEELTVGVTGPGGREHLDVLGIEQTAGVKFTPVFHNDSGLALNDLMGGNISAVQGSVADFTAQVANGRIRVLAVFSDKRSSFLPEVPTGEESGFTIYSGTSRGFALPAGAPDAAVTGLSDAIGKMAADPEMIKRVQDQGLELKYMDHTQYAAYWDSEVERLTALTAALPK
ncbi:MAG TPA: tripartite tricarboxylate transporter substrate binding protein [Devosia sp.]|nr:tripartite tricarboxylate transporter substrate binding protein [Devosia sp.]